MLVHGPTSDKNFRKIYSQEQKSIFNPWEQCFKNFNISQIYFHRRIPLGETNIFHINTWSYDEVRKSYRQKTYSPRFSWTDFRLCGVPKPSVDGKSILWCSSGRTR